MRPKHLIAISIIAMLSATMVIAHTRSNAADEWARFDHRSFVVAKINGDGSLGLEGVPDPVDLLAIVPMGEESNRWLDSHLLHQRVSLLLQSPQTRNTNGHLRAFVFLANQNLAVELTKAGLAYADRREKSVLDGLTDPAEAEARKKKRGLWATISYEQTPAWRQAWVRSLPRRR